VELRFSAVKKSVTPLPASEEDWQKARHRVSLYLRLMRVPPLESLDLALEAMKRAQSVAALEQHPLNKSMQALRDVLREHEALGTEAWVFADLLDLARVPLPAPLARGLCKGIRSQPPLNRGFMLPEEVF
jgi:hypothetical protein